MTTFSGGSTKGDDEFFHCSESYGLIPAFASASAKAMAGKKATAGRRANGGIVRTWPAEKLGENFSIQF